MRDSHKGEGRTEWIISPSHHIFIEQPVTVSEFMEQNKSTKKLKIIARCDRSHGGSKGDQDRG